MRIIQIMDTLTSTGGVNTFVFDLCIALKKAGQDVSLIGLIGDENKDDELARPVKDVGIPVYCLWFHSKKEALLHGVSALREQIKIIAEGKTVICNLHLKLSVLLGGLATKGLKNTICVETYHSQYSKYWLERKIMSARIDQYICCSESATKEFLERFHPKTGKVVCIPNGIDAEGLRSSIIGMQKRDKCKMTFLSVGRFTDQKNLHVTTKAFSEISSQKMVYKLIGDGPLKEKVVNSANNRDTVQFLGNVPRQIVICELCEADIAVMPSLWEGLSIFMLEAMAMGCPLMISDVESLRSVVGEKPLEKGEDWRRCCWGYLVSTNNVKAYTLAALDYLDHPEIKRQMSCFISKLAENYSIKTTAEKYIEVYGKLLCHDKNN